MAKRSKFFCIAVEGATCDGRTLDANALQEMAETYAPATYTARVNMEHIRGFSAEPPFNAYGDVVALETREVELQLGGKTEKKIGLFAQVDALDTLVELKNKGQKLFSSIELNPNFAGTGKAYLQGLAVTDSPASLGTEIMEFAAGKVKDGGTSLFADRKIEKGNFFSASHEIADLDFAEGDASEASALMSEAKGFFSSMREFFAQGGKPVEQASQQQQPPQNGGDDGNSGDPANDNLAAFADSFGKGFDKLTAAIEKQGSEFGARLDKLQGEHDTLKASIENTDAGAPRRTRATGNKTTDLSTFC